MRSKLRRQTPPPPVSVVPDEVESDDSDNSDDSDDGIESDSDDSGDEDDLEPPSPTAANAPSNTQSIPTTLRSSTITRNSQTVLVTFPQSTITAVVSGSQSTGLFIRPAERVTATPTARRGEVGAERTAPANSQSSTSQVTASPDNEPMTDMGRPQGVAPALIGSLIATGLVVILVAIVAGVLIKRRNRVRIGPPPEPATDTEPPMGQTDVQQRDAENPFRDPPRPPTPGTYYI
ncbi:predicted protein [Uncinocarpus reesii 1704]|uniref:Uncharacterized protein n=1 Tax=Uncinocarpus reesii (strain UAMH 1704) TaxID=336963 RepID=C4JPP0_UNCRE|nr:uncharacterized protein UREG_03212 [Uncinocarpus reesii 1704]EEP78366.1 predicted protein [Uncinocarpus reesii 1704]